MTSAANSRNELGRRILEERRATLLAELRQDIHDSCNGVDAVQSQDTLDEFDAGCATELADLRFSLMQMKGEALVRVEEALARIDQGNYGLCETCGAEIAEARLRALPFALRCTRCEQREEQLAEEKRQHDWKMMHRLRCER